MASKLSGKGDFELRVVVKPLVLFYRHLALLARCPRFSNDFILLLFLHAHREAAALVREIPEVYRCGTALP
jgi:hypothetical protein